MISDGISKRNSNIVGLYLIRMATEKVILWGISDKKTETNSNIVGLYLIE